MNQKRKPTEADRYAVISLNPQTMKWERASGDVPVDRKTGLTIIQEQWGPLGRMARLHLLPSKAGAQ